MPNILLNNTTIVIVVIILMFLLIWVYNQLIRRERLTQEAWSGIDIQLKLRYDLIPSLVTLVQGYSNYEAKTLEKIVALRSQTQNNSIPSQIEGEISLSKNLTSFFAVSENYPDLKADQQFIALQASLERIEERIQESRRYYNATVRSFNIFFSLFPINLIAYFFGFKEKEFFGLDAIQERNNIEVKL